MVSTLAKFESSGYLPVGTPKNPVYAAPVDNEEAFNHRIVDTCHDYPKLRGTFERMWKSMIIDVEACIEFHGGHFEHLL
jgi:hypothetical protein